MNAGPNMASERRMGRSDPTARLPVVVPRPGGGTNVPSAVCEAALAHVIKNRVEAAYNRTDLFDRRRDLMAAWAKFAKASA